MNPTFSKSLRGGKVALWVKIDGVSPHNIWDLPEEQLTPAVLSAIQSAFDRGVEFALQEMQQAMPLASYSIGNKWEGE